MSHIQRHLDAWFEYWLLNDTRFRIVLIVMGVVVFEASHYLSLAASTVLGDFFVRLGRLMAAPG